MLAKITAPDLPYEWSEAEQLVLRHKEYNSEIEDKRPTFKHFYNTGKSFIKENDSLMHDIEDKIRVLQQRMELLDTIWNKRNIIYNQNLDLQLFHRDANQLENWLKIREKHLKSGKLGKHKKNVFGFLIGVLLNFLGENIPQVEELIRKHRDFEEAIKVQEEKFENLKKITLIEDAFKMQQDDEAKARVAEKERLEHERLEQRKKMEMARLAELRRLESQEKEMRNKGEKVNGETVELKPTEVTTTQPQNGNGTTIRKTNSFAHMFERDRIRRDSAGAAVKRAESMKAGPISKTPKRTPSFNTKKRGSTPKITGKDIMLLLV